MGGLEGAGPVGSAKVTVELGNVLDRSNCNQLRNCKKSGVPSEDTPVATWLSHCLSELTGSEIREPDPEASASTGQSDCRQESPECMPSKAAIAEDGAPPHWLAARAISMRNSVSNWATLMFNACAVFAGFPASKA